MNKTHADGTVNMNYALVLLSLFTKAIMTLLILGFFSVQFEE